MPFRVSGLMKADVQSALTDQGYTAARATNLDATISSRAAAADYSAARAAKLDQLDAAISSRASATDYNATRAAKLDNLDAVISSRAAPGATMDLVAGAKTAIWNEAIPGTPTVGSFGERVKNNLDAAISSRAAPGAAMALASPYDARLDAAISTRASATDYNATRAAKLDNLDATIASRASPTDVGTQLDGKGVTTVRMAKLDMVGQSTNSGSVVAAGNSAGLSVQLDTTGVAGQGKAVVEVRYSGGGAATFFAEGSDDGSTWYQGDTFSEDGAVTNKLVGYLNTHRYFRFRSATTAIDLSFEVRALL